MHRYYLHRSGGACDITLDGDNFIEAIENNFDVIAKEAHIGNVAGYYLHSVTATYSDGILGGKGGAELTILAQGSEALVNYDEEKDPIKSYHVWIGGITKEDLLEPYLFEIKGKKPFDPFDDNDMYDDNFRLGVIAALIDKLASNYTKIKPSSFSLSNSLSVRFPTALQNDPLAFAKTLMIELNRLKVKDTPVATKHMNRINAIFAQIEHQVQHTGTYSIGFYKTCHYFNRIDQANQIELLREKTGKSQLQIASEVGISLRQYQRIESGDSRLEKAAYNTVLAIAKVLNVTPDSLVERQS